MPRKTTAPKSLLEQLQSLGHDEPKIDDVIVRTILESDRRRVRQGLVTVAVAAFRESLRPMYGHLSDAIILRVLRRAHPVNQPPRRGAPPKPWTLSRLKKAGVLRGLVPRRRRGPKVKYDFQVFERKVAERLTAATERGQPITQRVAVCEILRQAAKETERPRYLALERAIARHMDDVKPSEQELAATRHRALVQAVQECQPALLAAAEKHLRDARQHRRRAKGNNR